MIGGADKAGDPLSSADSQPGVVGDDHLNKHVSREKFFFDSGLLAFGDLDLFLGRDEYLEDPRSEPHGFNTSPEGNGDTVFVAGLGVNDVPFGRLRGLGRDDDVVLVRQLGADRFDFFFVDYFFHFIYLVLTAGDG
ncbi:MAG: hypothetical protein UW23_C0001G0017 [Candidatus Collierbacteria bacterium GW2011_GWA1_44_12]|uniref:Uncharacterized protein n=1 Tax=Candidatus Collierbacteria bacterium GW2011_GWA1_44_12 TaxID=1618376 RepID=A0A0G1IX79_9BACT|nr:MAG: hypothetical protein UW23_C0001G0017 [Candidatus Collierbacteria bacterium GW2011_GWA1_44_12]